ncbi:MAG: hypothetical protein ALECFALPRED_011000, partial [Alectoria fallacina]
MASLQEDNLLTETRLAPASPGRRFVTDIFQQVDEHQNDGVKEQLLPCMSSLLRSEEALLEVMQ